MVPEDSWDPTSTAAQLTCPGAKVTDWKAGPSSLPAVFTPGKSWEPSSWDTPLEVVVLCLTGL